MAERLAPVLKPALKFASTDRDRHIIKVLFCKLSSKTFLQKGSLGLSLNRNSLGRSEAFVDDSLKSMAKLEKSTTTYKLNQIKSSMSNRLPGSGRPFKCDQYPELVGIMFSLFDSAGQGFKAHPRLICDTLFLEKSPWMDMPRLVSILTEVFNVDISISAAYTYTENYRSGSYQARRHHATKKKNPNICLSRSTRDGQKKPSVNSHYASMAMKYALTDMFKSQGSIIARDNKAIVHTDVEVVQRPSKSWVRVQYLGYHMAGVN